MNILPIILAFTVILSQDVTIASEYVYNYDSCSAEGGKGPHKNAGALLTAGKNNRQLLPKKCTFVFQTVTTEEIFLVQVTHMKIRHVGKTCTDSLTVIESYSQSRNITNPILDTFCGDIADLPIETSYYTNGDTLRITWETKSTIWGEGKLTSPSSFSITLTSISQEPVVCDPKSHLRCTNNDCISKDLLCDGVGHCKNHGDEFDCHINTNTTMGPILPPPAPPLPTEATSGDEGQMHLYLPLIVVALFTVIMVGLILLGRKATAQQHQLAIMREDTNSSHDSSIIMTAISLATNFTLATANATTSTKTPPSYPTSTSNFWPLATTSPMMTGWEIGSPDLISVAIVGSVFAVVLVICIVLGCREKKEQNEGGRSNGQLNSNAGYTDSSGPPTPPPTYSYIERQASYVSDISQRSSQISVPPDYDEALDMPDSPSGRRRSRRRSRLSRSSTGSSRRRPRFPFFRSASAQDSRYRPRSSGHGEVTPGTRRTSQLASDAETLPSVREQVDHDDETTSPSDDNVFESPSSTMGETRAQVESDERAEQIALTMTAPAELEHSPNPSQVPLLRTDEPQEDPTSTNSNQDDVHVTFY